MIIKRYKVNSNRCKKTKYIYKKSELVVTLMD